ncbi:MAG TPA: PilZ domain-containing protein [Fibrobacteraceae bacterium]|nr:PilZ domain-containing protein [Fibrobacteraceae bacterium]
MVEAKNFPILVFETHADSRARWIRLLLAAGFSPVLASTREALIQGIVSGKFVAAMSKVSLRDPSFLLALRVFRERPELRHIQFLMVLEVAEEPLVLELIKSGFYNIVTRTQPDSVFFEKIGSIANRLGGSPDRRQHIRVPIMEYENAKLILSLPNARKITSLVRNISIGGVQVAFRERIFVRFSPGEVLTNCLLVFKNQDIGTDVSVITMLDKGLQLQFHQMDESRLNQIAKLVQERIQMEF